LGAVKVDTIDGPGGAVMTLARWSQRRGATAAIATLFGASMLIAACGAPSSQGVANVGHGGVDQGGTTTTPARANPTALLVEWASCMRRHGDPGQSDPTIDVHKVIHIDMPPNVQGGYNGYSGEYGNGGPGTHCRSLLNAAASALRGGKEIKRPSSTELVKFSQCMRANGILDFPDPGPTGLSLNMGGDLVPSDPSFQHASKVCAQKTGVRGIGATSQPGMIVLGVGDGLDAGNG
jgi:hypothetical protein